MALSSKQPFEAPGLDHTGTVGGNSERAAWNDSQRTYLLQQLCISPCGKKGRWSKDIWVKITESLKGEYAGCNFTIQQVKQQLQDLNKKYTYVRQILSRPGFTWDNKNCMLQASNECWILLELEGRIKPWCRKRIPYYAALVSLYEGSDVGAQVESNSNPIQIGAMEETADIALQGSSEEGHTLFNELSPLATNPLLTSYPNPQPASDYNMAVPSNVSEIPYHFQTEALDEAAGALENFHSLFTNGFTYQSNQMLLNFPIQQSNSQQFLDLAPNQPLFDSTPPSQPPHDRNGFFPSLSPNNLPHIAPSSNNCESSNNDTEMGCNLSVLAPLNADRASDSQQPGKENSFSNYSDHNPLRKVRGKRIQKNKPVAKSNFTPTKCVKMLYKLPGFETPDFTHATQIFRDDKNREFFMALKQSERAYWVREMIDERKVRLSTRKSLQFR